MTLRMGMTFLLGMLLTQNAGGDEIQLAGLKNDVQVCFDSVGVPHIGAKSWTDAYRVLGYVHATDRLWQMDTLRRRAQGTSAEVFGPDALASDILVRQLGIRQGCDAIWKSNRIPAAMRAQIEAYTAGVNAKIRQLTSDTLPAPFQQLGYEPAEWTPVDCILFGKYMAWDQSGTDADLWFASMVEKLGMAATEQLWPIDRPYDVPSVMRQSERADVQGMTVVSGSPPHPGPLPQNVDGSRVNHDQRLARQRFGGEGKSVGDRLAAESAATLPDSSGYSAAMRHLAVAGFSQRPVSFGSNNWAVSGKKTASGQAILCSDPHLGFNLPSLWYTCHLTAEGRHLAGGTFPGSPIVLIGVNDHVAWGVTNMQADAVDYFVETVHPSDPLQYKHRGEWKTVSRRSESIAIRGQPAHELTIDTTVHGPIISRDEKTVALAWTGLGPTTEMIAFWEMNHADGLEAFLNAADKLTAPALNLAYADAAGNIAVHCCGELPARLPGEGRIPMDGASGDHDWTGMIPRSQLPLEINPLRQFVATANSRPAPIDYPHYLGWMWDAGYRIRRIHDLLRDADALTVEKMQRIQNDVYDKCAERFLPVLLTVLDRTGPSDPQVRRATDILRQWDYVADIDSTAPLIWLRWFDLYRHAVWDDEWSSRGIEQPGGSWGFSGLNRREPMLEVLEYLTRSLPHSAWFDDRTTPQRETRDEIMTNTFALAVEQLTAEHGADPSDWKWGRVNQLHIRSMAGVSPWARDGGPVPGTSFTVNPGGGIGRVGGGASLRLIADFGKLDRSVAVYPGGQSEDATSPHYDDQMHKWARGQYAGLYLTIQPGDLPREAQGTMVQFKP